MKHFLIEDYEIKNETVIVTLQKSGVIIPITIPLEKFKFFLVTNGKLDWELNTSDHTGEHQQFTGSMTMDEYWGTDEKLIHEDLYEYITTNPITYRGDVYTDSVGQINRSFDLFIAKRRMPQIN